MPIEIPQVPPRTLAPEGWLVVLQDWLDSPYFSYYHQQPGPFNKDIPLVLAYPSWLRRGGEATEEDGGKQWDAFN